MEFEEARELMNRHRYNVENGSGKVSALAKDRKKLKLRTFLYRKESPNDETPEHYEIQYFNTTIIELHHDRVVLNDGGFFSYSTHQRLNEFAPRGFRVSGSYIRWLKYTVGFIHTPVGTYAYNMPFEASYDGSAGTARTSPDGDLVFSSPQAADALYKLRDYAKNYVEHLLEGKLTITATPTHNIPTYSADDIAGLLLTNVFYPSDIAVGLDQRGLGEAGAAISLSDVMESLLDSGVALLRKPRTKDEVAAKVEALYRLNSSVPTLHIGKLRKILLEEVTAYLTAALGFEEKNWNRR